MPPSTLEGSLPRQDPLKAVAIYVKSQEEEEEEEEVVAAAA